MSDPPRVEAPRGEAPPSEEAQPAEPGHVDLTRIPEEALPPDPGRADLTRILVQDLPPLSVPPPGWRAMLAMIPQWLDRHVLGASPTFLGALLRLAVLSVILYTRLPTTNYIFDEQEALLANPYVNATGDLRFIDAIHRDFWGLPADRSVGSYRPIPNFLWRAMWVISKQPFLHHFYNVLFHAVNGAILVAVTWRLTRQRTLAWLTGTIFVSAAVLTEAVSGIVGIADVLGGMGALVALGALMLPAWGMPFVVFLALLFGLFCKESALVCVPLIPFAALLAAPLTHPERPARVLRTLLALVASTAAFVLYVELRKRWFLAPMPAELEVPLPEGATQAQQLVRDFLVWFHQAPLPKDPLNNPLAEADMPHRIAGAMRVYWRGLGQVVFPRTLSGDYSFPQEPVPDELYGAESVAGALFTVLPPLASVVLWIVVMVRERRARRAAIERAAFGGVYGPKLGPGQPALRIAGAAILAMAAGMIGLERWVLQPGGYDLSLRGIPWWWGAPVLSVLGLGLFIEARAPLRRPDPPGLPVPLGRAALVMIAVGITWVVVSYFPHSNIPVVLPTVRAERFWYFPVLGSSLALAAVFAWIHERAAAREWAWASGCFIAVFLGFQWASAYSHAMDYRDDLAFWEATKDAVPNSSKAHLNYSVMKGARGDLETRLIESQIAIELAPEWAMAHVYTGDTLCRMHRPEEAWPHYKKGFGIGPNELALIALALQCMHDEGSLYKHDEELRALAEEHKGSWIAYLAIDTLDNSEKNNGVDPKYRPRGYNEGPKDGGE